MLRIYFISVKVGNEAYLDIFGDLNAPHIAGVYMNG